MAAVCVVVGAPAWAQSDTAVQALPPVVITASRGEQALPDALPSTRVITRREIEQSAAQDLPSLLRVLTSADVAQTGPLGSQTSVFLRGADSRQTLVLVDGVPLSRADFGTASWQHLPLDQIERIEIVRGNLSSLYGAQAVGGVVQIVTRRADAPQLNLAAGSQGLARASIAAGRSFDASGLPLRLSASASHQRTSGYSARDAAVDPGANADRDPSRQSSGSARAEYTWAAGQRTSLNLMTSRTRSAYDGFAPGLNDELTTRVEAAGLKTEHALTQTVKLAAEAGQTTEQFNDPTGFAVQGRNRVRLAGVQLAIEPIDHHSVQLGIESRRERFGDSQTAMRGRNTDSARIGWSGRFADDALQWQLNARSDRSSAYGHASTGLMALAYQWDSGLKLSAQLSSGFSAPSFLDEQFANPATTLRPERSRQGELALQWSRGAWLARAAWFEQRQRDRIAFDPVTFESLNIARARNRGLELMGEVPLAVMPELIGTLGFEATFQNPRDLDTGALLKRRARESLAVNYRAGIGAWQGAVYVRHTGKRLDTDPVSFADATSPARTTLDVSLHWQVSSQWRLGAAVANLGQSRAPEVLGYTPAPRAWTLSVSGSLL